MLTEWLKTFCIYSLVIVGSLTILLNILSHIESKVNKDVPTPLKELQSKVDNLKVVAENFTKEKQFDTGTHVTGI